MRRLGVVLLVGGLIAAAAGGQESGRGPTVADANRYRQSGDLDRAIATYEAIVRSDPDNGEAWFLLGYTLHESGDMPRAIFAHQKAARFTEQRPVALYNLGCAYALSSDPDKAFEALRDSVAAGFGNRAQFENDPDLRSLRDDPRWEELFRGESADRNLELDFWLGSWQVVSSRGRLRSQHTVTAQMNGFILHESSTGPEGSAEGMHYFDQSDRRWRYVSIDERGGVSRCAGQWSENALRYQGQRIHPDGSTVGLRWTLAPQPDGAVRQTIEYSYDNGQTWRPTLDARHTRPGADGSGIQSAASRPATETADRP
jgi:tetratricopeptide (TPR) repeat protein